MLAAMAATISRAQLSAAELNDLPDSAFAYIEPGGTRDSGGRTVPRSKRHFAIHDAAQVAYALARIGQGAQFGQEAMPKVRAAAKRLGVEVAGEPAMASRAADLDTWPAVITRAYALDDVSVRPGRINCETCGRDATGRIVDAYAAVFNQEALIEENGRRYRESNHPDAFNKRLADLSRSRRRFGDVAVFYHHGLNLYGEPVAAAPHPVGHPMAIRADAHGLLTSTHYGTTDFADRVFTDVVEGNVTGHSYTGRIIRSDPPRVPRAAYGAELPRVVRLELGLAEYGPTPIPYYDDAQLVGVRAAPLDSPEPAEPASQPVQAAAASSMQDIRRRIRKARLLGRV
jgi:phage head maturation protease